MPFCTLFHVMKGRSPMAKSMTAFGRARRELDGKTVTVEIKSVNSRYLDLQIRTSRMCSPLEDRIKSRVSAAISRGKVELSISIDQTKKSNAAVELDTAYAESYINALRKLRDTFSLSDDISVMTVAQNRDVFSVSLAEADLDRLWEEILPVLDEALESFDRMRAAEGERLHIDLVGKKEKILSLVDRVEQMSASSVDGYREKFEARIRKLISESGVEIDEARILTECAIYADKVAIDEEIVRLRSHFVAFDEIFAQSEPIGRKLDFLVQEINRETNTIGSKCTDSSIARIVVDIKSEIEKIREQIQNIE